MTIENSSRIDYTHNCQKRILKCIKTAKFWDYLKVRPSILLVGGEIKQFGDIFSEGIRGIKWHDILSRAF